MLTERPRQRDEMIESLGLGDAEALRVDDLESGDGWAQSTNKNE